MKYVIGKNDGVMSLELVEDRNQILLRANGDIISVFRENGIVDIYKDDMEKLGLKISVK